jgi:hypothetical protein
MQRGAKLIAHREFLGERAQKLPRQKRGAPYLRKFDTYLNSNRPAFLADCLPRDG